MCEPDKRSIDKKTKTIGTVNVSRESNGEFTVRVGYSRWIPHDNIIGAGGVALVIIINIIIITTNELTNLKITYFIVYGVIVI